MSTDAKDSGAKDSGKYAKPGDPELRKRLTPEQYEVTQKEGTEPPFRNAYWDNHGGAERSVSITQQHADLIPSRPESRSRNEGKILVAVVIDIADAYRGRSAGECVINGWLEGAIAIAKQNGCISR